MLQAPTTETKKQSESSHTAAERKPQPEVHSRSGAIEGVSAAGMPASAAPSGPAPLRQHFAELQRTIGNQAVLHKLGRSGQARSLTPSPSAISILQRKCACGGSEGECQACKEQRNGALLQRKTKGISEESGVPAIVDEVLRSPGQSLDPGTRAFFEPRFGHDFSRVRVHADATAAESARSVNALAYTLGRNVVFGENQYAPQTETGNGLLVHELTHVIQQGTALIENSNATASARTDSTGPQLQRASACGVGCPRCQGGATGPPSTQAPLSGARTVSLQRGETIEATPTTEMEAMIGRKEYPADFIGPLQPGDTRAVPHDFSGALEPGVTRSKAFHPTISVVTPVFRELQRSIGNHALGRLIQAKLKVSEPNDPHEQEADRVAEQVMRMPDPTTSHETQGVSRQLAPQIQRMCTDCEEEEKAEVPQVQRKCDACDDEKIHRMAAEEEEQEEERVHRKTADANEIDPKLESELSDLGGGQPLSDSARSFFEPRFGHSFSDVRVHTGVAANRAAKSINAKAFTLGNNIAFASGEYDSSSASGRILIAHELTHTLQQSAGAKSVQRGSAGIFGGKGCLRAPGVEWALVGAGVWKRLSQGDCTGTLEDADGMTCGGGFYRIDNGQTGSCSNPRHDDATFAPRRWTPTLAAESATSPTQEGSTAGDTPPGYVYDAGGSVTYPGCTNVQDTAVEAARLTALSKSNNAAAAMTALKGGTGTAIQQAALTAHFTALSAEQFDTAKNRYDTISNRLRTPSLFACGSAPAQAYCGPPQNWCAGTGCPTTTGISYICPGAFTPSCAEPDLWSVLLHESGRAAGCCPPDVMSTDPGYPPAAPACLTNVYCYSGFARAI